MSISVPLTSFFNDVKICVASYFMYRVSREGKYCTKFLNQYSFIYDSGQLSTKIYDKWDDFNFKIINFPNMCSNIPASPAYGVYISQLIRYARASNNYSDFLKRHLHLRNRLLDQGYKKFICRLCRNDYKQCIFI